MAGANDATQPKVLRNVRTRKWGTRPSSLPLGTSRTLHRTSGLRRQSGTSGYQQAPLVSVAKGALRRHPVRILGPDTGLAPRGGRASGPTSYLTDSARLTVFQEMLNRPAVTVPQPPIDASLRAPTPPVSPCTSVNGFPYSDASRPSCQACPSGSSVSSAALVSSASQPLPEASSASFILSSAWVNLQRGQPKFSRTNPSPPRPNLSPSLNATLASWRKNS